MKYEFMKINIHGKSVAAKIIDHFKDFLKRNRGKI